MVKVLRIRVGVLIACHRRIDEGVDFRLVRVVFVDHLACGEAAFIDLRHFARDRKSPMAGGRVETLERLPSGFPGHSEEGLLQVGRIGARPGIIGEANRQDQDLLGAGTRQGDLTKALGHLFVVVFGGDARKG